MNYTEFTYSGVKFRLYGNGGEQRVLVYGHGFGGHSDNNTAMHIIGDVVPGGVAVLTFDLPCHGEDPTTGALNYDQCQQYWLAAMQYANKNYKANNISIFVNSFGAFLLLNYLKNKTIIYDKIILQCPAIFMYNITKYILLPVHNYKPEDIDKAPVNLGYERELIIDKKFLDDLSKNAINCFTNKNFFYILQGQQDDVVNNQNNKRFYDKFFENRYKIFYFLNADHRFKKPGELEEIIKIVHNLLFNS